MILAKLKIQYPSHDLDPHSTYQYWTRNNQLNNMLLRSQTLFRGISCCLLFQWKMGNLHFHISDAFVNLLYFIKNMLLQLGKFMREYSGSITYFVFWFNYFMLLILHTNRIQYYNFIAQSLSVTGEERWKNSICLLEVRQLTGYYRCVNFLLSKIYLEP